MNTRTRPGQKRGGGFAAAHPLVRRAGYGSAPPASRLLRIADATALRAGLDPGDLCGPSARKYGQAQPAPPNRAARPMGPYPRGTRNAQAQCELAFDSQNKRQNYTNPL